MSFSANIYKYLLKYVECSNSKEFREKNKHYQLSSISGQMFLFTLQNCKKILNKK